MRKKKVKRSNNGLSKNGKRLGRPKNKKSIVETYKDEVPTKINKDIATYMALKNVIEAELRIINNTIENLELLKNIHK